jgi:DNA ligase-1
MNTIEILEKLESNNSRLFKESLLREHKDNETLRRALIMAADPWKNWGVVKYDKPSSNGAGHDDAALVSFMDLLDLLNDRKLTGNKARGAVEGAISVFDEIGQKWTERLLWRNLRCGVAATTINKVWPGSVVPFAVALADTLTTVGVNGNFTITDPIKYPVRVEAKLDGLRCIAVKHNGEVSMFTRSGTPIETLPRIKAAIAALPLDNFVLDGEAMADSWEDSASVMMSSKTKKDDGDMRYHVFDCVPFAEWQAQKSETHYSARLLDISMVVGDVQGTPFRYVKSTRAADETELRSFYAECLDEGYEGVMLKDMAAPYRWKRSGAILKLKPVCTTELVVVGHYTGNVGSKHEGTWGGFKAIATNGVATNIGGGFNDKIRAEIKAAGPDAYIGSIIECEYQPDSLSSNGFTADGKLRFPVFTRFRDISDVVDENIKKIASKAIASSYVDS